MPSPLDESTSQEPSATAPDGRVPEPAGDPSTWQRLQSLADSQPLLVFCAAAIVAGIAYLSPAGSIVWGVLSGAITAWGLVRVCARIKPKMSEGERGVLTGGIAGAGFLLALQGTNEVAKAAEGLWSQSGDYAVSAALMGVLGLVIAAGITVLLHSAGRSHRQVWSPVKVWALVAAVFAAGVLVLMWPSGPSEAYRSLERNPMVVLAPPHTSEMGAFSWANDGSAGGQVSITKVYRVEDGFSSADAYTLTVQRAAEAGFPTFRPELSKQRGSMTVYRATSEDGRWAVAVTLYQNSSNPFGMPGHYLVVDVWDDAPAGDGA